MSLHNENLEELFGSYLDGELPPERAAELESRLARDPALAARLETMRRTVDLVRELPRLSAPRGLKARVLHAAERADLLKQEQVTRSLWWVGALARAAIILLVVGGGFFLLHSLNGPSYTPIASKAPEASRNPYQELPAPPVVAKVPSEEHMTKGGPGHDEVASVNVVINTKDMDQTRREVEAVLKLNGADAGVAQLQAVPASSGPIGLAEAARKQVITFAAEGTQVDSIIHALKELRADVELPETDTVYAAADATTQQSARGPVATGSTAEQEYYCPMHPAVVRDQKGDCPQCHMPLVSREKLRGSTSAPATAPASRPAPTTQPAAASLQPTTAPTTPAATDLSKAISEAERRMGQYDQAAEPAQRGQQAHMQQAAQQARSRQMVIILNSVTEKSEAVTAPAKESTQAK